MRYFILDTNFLMIYLRGDTKLKSLFDTYRLDEDDAILLVSVVTIAEILTLAKRRNWGENRMIELEKFLHRLIIIDILTEDKELLNSYVEIDTFSQSVGKKMGKNDVWIAATTKVANATLITSDHDFDHLGGMWIAVVKF